MINPNINANNVLGELENNVGEECTDHATLYLTVIM